MSSKLRQQVIRIGLGPHAATILEDMQILWQRVRVDAVFVPEPFAEHLAMRDVRLHVLGKRVAHDLHWRDQQRRHFREDGEVSDGDIGLVRDVAPEVIGDL